MSEKYYEAGKCNINDVEAAYKRALGIIFILTSVALAYALYVFGVPGIYGVSLIFPLWLAIMQYLQVKNRFCATYGIKGFHVSGPGRGKKYLVRVSDTESRKLDKAKSKVIILQALLVATIISLAYSAILST